MPAPSSNALRSRDVAESSTPAKFGRALRLRCPRCGGGRILRGWFKMVGRCPTCGLALERGESSEVWIGAYVFNLVAGEVLAIGIPIIWMIASAPRQPWAAIEATAVVLAILLPI